MGSYCPTKHRKIMTYEEIADKYIRESYIDYGDLNEEAEQHIKEAVIFGLKQGKSLPIDSATAKTMHYDLVLKANEIMKNNEKMEIKDFRKLPKVVKLWNAMDVIKEHYL